MEMCQNQSILKHCRIALDNFMIMIDVAANIYKSQASQAHPKNTDFYLCVHLQSMSLFRSAEVWLKYCLFNTGVIDFDGVGELRYLIMLPHEADCLPSGQASFFYYDKYKLSFSDGSVIELPLRDHE